jgi:hypothetical protein
VLAHVSDANADAPPCQPAGACDLSAGQIDWGDGMFSPATLQPDPAGGLDIVGPAHTYSGPGSYRIAVTVTDQGGASAAASGDYTGTAPPVAAAGCDSPVPQRGETTGLYGQPLNQFQAVNWASPQMTGCCGSAR